MPTLSSLLVYLSQIVGDLSPASTSATVTFLINIITAGVQEVVSIYPQIKNFIAALQNRGNISAIDLAALAQAEATLDAQFQAAVQADGIALDNSSSS